jgi:TrmH family RNA methyltransferase
LKDRKHRRATGLFWVEGEKLTLEALRQSAFEVETVVATREYADKRPDFPFPPKRTAWVSPAGFERLSQLERSEPVGAVMAIGPPTTEVPSGEGFVLWGVQDPGNLGAVLRVADWFGYRSVVTAAGTVDVYNLKTLRAAMGSAFRVPVIEVADGEEFIRSRAHECVCAEAHEGMRAESPSTWSPFKRFIVLGSEARGLPASVKNMTPTVRIPGGGGAESLNVAVAAGILAFAKRTFDETGVRR